MNIIKSNNQLVNTLLFPGSIMLSSYDTNTYNNNFISPDHDLDFDPEDLQLLYIPFKSNSDRLLNICDAPKYIPALLQICRKNEASVFVIHAHGNACDVNHISMCATRESYSLNSHYLIVEFPSYGISTGTPSESLIDEIFYVVYNFVVKVLKVPSHKIVLTGRSIGTGVLVKLAAILQVEKRPAAALILQSPYTSLRNAAAALVGNCISSTCMLERWENWKLLCRDSSISCPVLFIHADADQIIDIHHSESMHSARLKLGLSSTLYVQKSSYDFIKGHNHYDYDKDVVIPSRDFLLKYVPIQGSWSLNLDIIKQYIVKPFDLATHNKNTSKIWTCINFSRWAICPCVVCCESGLAVTCNTISLCYCDDNEGFDYQPKAIRSSNKETDKLKKLLRTGSIRSLDDISNREARATINPIFTRHETIIFDDKKEGSNNAIEYIPG